MKIRYSVLASMFVLLPAFSLFAQQTPQSFAEAELPSLLAIYKDIHTHPELSGHEERTASLITKELRAAGCQVTEHLGKYENSKLKGYGVVGVMKNGNGPTVLVRTDMDALPVTEQTGAAYASALKVSDEKGNIVGVMHACGHDMHMTILLGTARLLGELREKWHGTVVMIGQPAEEKVAGAAKMLRDGLFTRFPKPNY